MGKHLRKATEKLQARQRNYLSNPPRPSNSRSPQDHGYNSNGNMAKIPGSMKR